MYGPVCFHSSSIPDAKRDRASEIIFPPSQQSWGCYLRCLWHKIKLTADPNLVPECAGLEKGGEQAMKGTRKGV